MRSGIMLGLAVLLAGLIGSGCSSGSGADSDAGLDAGDGGGGDGHLDGPCQVEADCHDSQFCLAPGAHPGCGTPCMAERLCETTQDCVDQMGSDTVCVEYRHPCCPPEELSTMCQERCTTCEEGFRCNQEGICEPIPCDEGYTCPVHTLCQPGSPGHGCERITCTSDADCQDEGLCVLGACYQEPGTCSWPVP